MTCPCGCCDQETTEDMNLWVSIGMIAFGLIVADQLTASRRTDA